MGQKPTLAIEKDPPRTRPKNDASYINRNWADKDGNLLNDKGEVEHDQAAIKDYLEPTQGKLRVYRCPNCHVRIAQEFDLLRRATFVEWDFAIDTFRRGYFERKVYAATFKRVFNLRHDGKNNVVCLRCGTKLFPYDKDDPWMLTIPLYYHGKKTLLKTPVRAICVVDHQDPDSCLNIMNLKGEVREFGPNDLIERLKTLEEHLEQSSHPNIEVEWTTLVRLPPWLSDRRKEIEENHFPKVVEGYKERGVTKFKLIPYHRFTETIDQLATHDFGVIFKYYDHGFIVWTDYNAEKVEPVLLGLWLLCGGNVVFGEWFVPEISSREQKLDDFPFEYYANLFMRHDDDETNIQQGFSQLVRDGHYLGYWNDALESPPELVFEKIKLGLENSMLYPHWQFLKDFPNSVFDNPLRYDDEYRANPRKEPGPFAILIKDKIVPNSSS